VKLRARWVENGAKIAAAYLPITAIGDATQSRRVALPSRLEATLSEYQLAATAHPDIQDLARKYLQVPVGPDKTDLLILSASGTREAMARREKTVVAIFTSLQLAKPAP
jgi:hypothetical protein